MFFVFFRAFVIPSYAGEERSTRAMAAAILRHSLCSRASCARPFLVSV